MPGARCSRSTATPTGRPRPARLHPTTNHRPRENRQNTGPGPSLSWSHRLSCVRRGSGGTGPWAGGWGLRGEGVPARFRSSPGREGQARLVLAAGELQLAGRRGQCGRDHPVPVVCRGRHAGVGGQLGAGFGPPGAGRLLFGRTGGEGDAAAGGALGEQRAVVAVEPGADRGDRAGSGGGEHRDGLGAGTPGAQVAGVGGVEERDVLRRGRRRRSVPGRAGVLSGSRNTGWAPGASCRQYRRPSGTAANASTRPEAPAGS